MPPIRLAVALAATLALTLHALTAGAAPPSPKADLVLRQARIHTMDERQPLAEAVAIRDGRYVAVGSEAQVRRWIGPRTTVVDLQGAMAMPGLNDVHQHPGSGGWEALYGCNMPPRPELDFVLRNIADCARRSAPGDWIIGGAWSSGLLAQLASPQALQALDAASAGHPVVLRDDTYHNRWVNSAALRLAGIGPESVSPPGGEVVKDPATGAPVGLLKEFPAFRAVEAQVPPRTAERRSKAAQEALRINNSFGITGVLDAYVSDSELQVWHALDRRSPLSLWFKAALSFTPSPDPTERHGDALVKVRGTLRTERVMPDVAKLFLDGVPPARTALFIEPYLDQPGHPAHEHGQANYSPAELLDILTRMDRQGIPVKVHAAGDGAVRMVLDAVAEVRRRNGPNGPRHQVAHASYIADADLPRFKALNVTADLSPMLWFPTGLFQASAAVLGQERAARWWPVKRLVQSGALVAGGSDWPAGQDTPNPWIGIEGLVTRADPLGQFPGRMWPEQAVDLATALRIYTLNSAQAMGLGAQTGSVTVGKSADLIVLDRDLFKVPATELHQVQVQRTYFQGRLVHQR